MTKGVAPCMDIACWEPYYQLSAYVGIPKNRYGSCCDNMKTEKSQDPVSRRLEINISFWSYDSFIYKIRCWYVLSPVLFTTKKVTDSAVC